MRGRFYLRKSFEIRLTKPALCDIITALLRQNTRVWRNWQTRMVQVHVKAISCRFKSCYPHQTNIIRTCSR